MGSGEADAVREIKLDLSNQSASVSNNVNWGQTISSSSTGGGYWDSMGVWHPNTYTYFTTWPTTIYKYQVKCPSCKKMNWLELDKITRCIKCQSKLKAVSQVADYEVEIET